MTPDRGLQPDLVADLYVMRDTMRPQFWRLCWSRPDSDSYCMAEGECSAIYYRTMADARAYGMRRYGERAKRAPWGC
jgi:hypothetical protein